MVRNDAYDIIHATNYAALCIAILRPSPITIEDAFELYERTPEDPRERKKDAWHRREVNHKERMQEMAGLRAAGWSWIEIGQALGLKAPQCYFSRHKYLLKNRLIDFGKLEGSVNGTII